MLKRRVQTKYICHSTHVVRRQLVLNHVALSIKAQIPLAKTILFKTGLTNLLLTTAVRYIGLYWLWSRSFWDLEKFHSPKLQDIKKKFNLSHSVIMWKTSDTNVASPV